MTEPTSATGADWVGAARRKWADYQRVLAEAPDNHIAAGIRERALVGMVPHLIAAYDNRWAEVEAWLKARRDHTMQGYGLAWFALDSALDDLREHAATGTPLDQPVHVTTQDDGNDN